MSEEAKGASPDPQTIQFKLEPVITHLVGGDPYSYTCTRCGEIPESTEYCTN